MSLLIEADREEGYAGWRDVFRQVMPAMDIHWWNDPKVDPQDVEVGARVRAELADLPPGDFVVIAFRIVEGKPDE